MEQVTLNRRETSDLLLAWSTDINIAYQALKQVTAYMEDIETEKEQSVILLAIKELERVSRDIQHFDMSHL